MRVRFNEILRGPVALPFDEFETYYAALKKFVQLVNSDELQIERTLEKGEMIVFNNWRVMHGRKTAAANRIIVGGTIALESFKSKMRLVFDKYADKNTMRDRVGVPEVGLLPLFTHVTLLVTKHQLMTASMVHVTNLMKHLGVATLPRGGARQDARSPRTAVHSLKCASVSGAVPSKERGCTTNKGYFFVSASVVFYFFDVKETMLTTHTLIRRVLFVMMDDRQQQQRVTTCL